MCNYEGITVVTLQTLQSLLYNLQDKLSDVKKSEIYGMNGKDYEEYFVHTLHGRSEKSSVANHVLEKNNVHLMNIVIEIYI